MRICYTQQLLRKRSLNIALGYGAHNLLGPKILCQQEGLITMVICCKFKKESLQPLTLYTSFHDLINVYSHRSGADNPRGPRDKSLMSTETSCHLDHLLQVKKKTKKHFVWFYTIFFMILYMYISPGKGLTTPWGQNFDVNRNLLSLQSYVASFKKSPWSLTLYNKCSLAEGRQPPGNKVLMSTDMSCHFIHLLQV